MFLRKRGTTWSGDLLRDELVHAGIRHCRTRLDMGADRAVKAALDLDEAMVPPPGAAPEEHGQLNG